MNLPLTFEYRISVADHCASHLVCQSKDGSLHRELRRATYRFMAYSAAFAGAAALGWWLNHAQIVAVPVELTVIAGVIGGLGLWLSIMSLTRKPTAPEPSHTLPENPQLAKWERHPLFRGSVGPEKLEISEAGVTETRVHSTLHVDWEEIDRIHRGPAHVFIVTCTGAVFTLPHRAIAHLNVEALCTLIEDQIAKHRPADVADPPATAAS